MESYMKDLNKEQYEAATTTEGSLLILAGAGSGKTKTLVHRVAYMIDHGADPESVLLLTFTNKAADEMKLRAKRMLEKLGKDCGIEATTFHSFCAKMLRIYGNEAGIKSDFRIITPAEETTAVDCVKVDLGMQNINGMPMSAKIVGFISSAENKRIPLKEAVPDKFKEFVSYIEEIRKKLKEYKAERNYFSFDDILAVLINVLKNNENIRRKIEERYRYIMVDEYQDTNIAQDEILSLLRKENRNLAVVGDDMQSIYGFRGAQVQNILTFADRWEGCKTVRLETNYRSTAEILDVANVVARNSSDGLKTNMRSARGKGIVPSVVSSYDQTEEIHRTMCLIREAHESGVPYDGICVLARASASFAKLEIELKKAGIPYEKRGGQKFIDKDHVQEVLSCLRIMADPKDELAWFRILKVLEGVGPVYARNIADVCRDFGYDGVRADTMSHPRRAYTKNTEECAETLKKMSGMDFHDALPEVTKYYIRKRTEAVDHMKTGDEANRSQAYDQIKEDEEDLETLMEIAGGYASLNDFLDDMTLNDGIESESEGKPLVLSTIHSVKGLEYDTVIIMDCTKGLMPRESVKYGDDEYDEELRCFYVAVTRAKDRLYIMHPQKIVQYGKNITGGVTPFLRGAENMLRHR